MKRSPIKRRAALRRPKVATRIKPRSDRRKVEETKYTAAKAEFQRQHPACQMPGCKRSLLKGDLIDLHHKAGRNGPLLYCKRYFASLCRHHHEHVENNLSWSRANGWIVDVPTSEVRALREAEL